MSRIPCQRKYKKLGHSIKHPSKGNGHTDFVLLQRKLYLALNWHIRHGRALTNVGLWSHVNKIVTGVRQMAEYYWKPWSLKNGYRKEELVF